MEKLDVSLLMKDVVNTESPAYNDHLKVCRWMIRNRGAIGFGPLQGVEPRKIYSVDEEGQWIFYPGFKKEDLDHG